MSMLRSAVDEYAGEELSGLPDGRLEEDFEELQRMSDRLEYERLRRLDEIRRRRLHERDGHLSVTTWLAHRFHVGYGIAAEQVRTARALAAMPGTRPAFAAGDVSASAVRVLATAQSTNAAAFEGSEDLLLESARTLSIRELQRVVAYWRDAADARSPVSDEERFARRRLHVSTTIFDRVRVDGDLDPETGQVFLSALGAIIDAESRKPDDGRSMGQRRADALGELSRQFLDGSDRPIVAGERPHLVVNVDLATLRDGVGPAELDDAGTISASVALRLACDAAVTRVITRGRSEPLDVGRKTPVVPVALRRAVIVRDRTCRFPGCDRPQTWCDAHHVVHWAHGGPTALSNLVLLCRRHHRLVHQGFEVTMAEGTPVFRRSDASILEERAPP